MNLSRSLGGLLGVALISLLAAGCGGPSGPAAGPGAGASVAPPPRPGEDVMKEQMEKLIAKKGRLPKRIGLPTKK